MSAPPCDPKTPFPEVRELIRLARAYLTDGVHYSQVCCAIGPFRDAAHLFSADPAIRAMADEWFAMAIRVWPEFAQDIEPITEVEFKRWIQSQLTVFEPADA